MSAFINYYMLHMSEHIIYITNDNNEDIIDNLTSYDKKVYVICANKLTHISGVQSILNNVLCIYRNPSNQSHINEIWFTVNNNISDIINSIFTNIRIHSKIIQTFFHTEMIIKLFDNINSNRVVLPNDHCIIRNITETKNHCELVITLYIADHINFDHIFIEFSNNITIKYADEIIWEKYFDNMKCINYVETKYINTSVAEKILDDRFKYVDNFSSKEIMEFVNNEHLIKIYFSILNKTHISFD
jgi:hypothetical protein